MYELSTKSKIFWTPPTDIREKRETRKAYVSIALTS